MEALEGMCNAVDTVCRQDKFNEYCEEVCDIILRPGICRLRQCEVAFWVPGFLAFGVSNEWHVQEEKPIM